MEIALCSLLFQLNNILVFLVEANKLHKPCNSVQLHLELETLKVPVRKEATFPCCCTSHVVGINEM